MKLKTKIILTALSCSCVLGTTAQTHKGKAKKKQSSTIVKKIKRNDNMKNNPFYAVSTLPFGAPNFNIIKNSDYIPAFKYAIEKQRAEIEILLNKKEKPTFANTILAYENCGQMLSRVSSTFFALSGAHATPEIEAIEAEVIPLLTAFSNEITFNTKLFERIKTVYNNEYSTLQGEDKKLLKEIYDGFVRSGALITGEKKTQLENINNRIAVLQQQFGKELPKATNAAVVWVSNKSDLKGLSESEIAQCEQDAKDRDSKEKYCIVIVNTTQQAILAKLDNRDLRKKVYEASIHRTDGTGEFNTYPIIVEIAKLRAEKANILGYNNYAEYTLSDKMAKNPKNVNDFLGNLIAAYKPKADAETAEIEAYARQQEGENFNLQPYDRFYYSAKLKKERYSFSEDEIKPYFNVDSVLINGVFYAANRVYGISFKQRNDIPVYHPDVKVYEVIDTDNKTLALFYFDPFRRQTKRGGAWMGEFAKQSTYRNQTPLIYNVCNSAKAPEGQPSLVTWDEVTTMFHEFGHALHGILSNCKYNTLSGTDVARDFVELPSQFNEYFASVPEIFNNYAKHYATKQPMPNDLKEKMLNSINFHAAYSLGENLAATCVDLAWHELKANEIPTAENAGKFQEKSLENVGLLNNQIPPRYSTSYFNHVWGGGYAAGYYSYLWSEVLSVNVGDYFTQHGSLNREVGDAYREKIVSRGNTDDPGKMFTDFTGLQQPDATGLLKARGL